MITPMQIVEYSLAFLVVAVCACVVVCALAFTVGGVRDNFGGHEP